jgi:hypothetical protein
MPNPDKIHAEEIKKSTVSRDLYNRAFLFSGFSSSATQGDIFFIADLFCEIVRVGLFVLESYVLFSSGAVCVSLSS